MIPLAGMIAAAAFAILIATPAFGQSVPEGVHRDANGPSTMCGITASDALALRAQVERGDFERQDGGPRFDLFVSQDGDDIYQWAFTKPGEKAHPAATCRHVYKDAQGSLLMERGMRCDASRASCDALFLEFEDLDRRLTAELRGQ